jgi:hypothetical protein
MQSHAVIHAFVRLDIRAQIAQYVKLIHFNLDLVQELLFQRSVLQIDFNKIYVNIRN